QSPTQVRLEIGNSILVKHNEVSAKRSYGQDSEGLSIFIEISTGATLVYVPIEAGDARRGQILESTRVFETRHSSGTAQRCPDARERRRCARSRHGLYFDPAHNGFTRSYPANLRLRRKFRSRRIGALRDANQTLAGGKSQLDLDRRRRRISGH